MVTSKSTAPPGSGDGSVSVPHVGGSRRGSGVAALVAVLLVLGARRRAADRIPLNRWSRVRGDAGCDHRHPARPPVRRHPGPVPSSRRAPRPPPPVLAGLPSQVPPPTNAGLAAALGQTARRARLGLGRRRRRARRQHRRVAARPGRRGAPHAGLDREAAHRRGGPARLGPQARLTTTVVRGAAPGEVVLVGGGDPLLSRQRRARQACASWRDARPRRCAPRGSPACASGLTTRCSRGR